MSVDLSRITWKHVKTGHLYRIRCFAIDEDKMWPVVIYERWDSPTGQIWSRRAHQFFDGRFVDSMIDEHERTIENLTERVNKYEKDKS